MNKTIKAMALVASLVLMGFSPVLADTAAPTVTVDGMVDAYMTYNFDDGADLKGNVNQYWNTSNNSFSLGLAEVKVTATQGKASAVVQLAYQDDPELGLPTDSNGDSFGLNVLQAYAAYTTDGFTFTAGRFDTWIGYEVIESTGNINYSHSLLFWYTIPLWNQGLSVNYTTSDSVLSASLYATNGWNSIAQSGNGFTYGGQLAWTPNSTWKFVANGIVGPGTDSYGFTDKDRWVAELIASYNATSKLSLGLDATYGGSDLGSEYPEFPFNSVDIGGVALYAKYAMSNDWSANLRLETVSALESGLDEYGLPGSGGTSDTNTVREGTLTITHAMTPAWTISAEGRYDYDIVNGSVPTPGNGPYANGAADQLTATVSTAYVF